MKGWTQKPAYDVQPGDRVKVRRKSRSFVVDYTELGEKEQLHIYAEDGATFRVLAFQPVFVQPQSSAPFTSNPQGAS